ncbi:LacI family DNA-binding transcriptional regulator [Hydrogenophaga sp.]|uniref:LacI family DNA-binding transcriptional regulator n=1 Tax=Hydrogenophaga sp. TaxID=1904254 RepID=UPI003D119D32
MEPKTPVKSRATLEDVALDAQVSLATADRVVNKRPGVRPATVARVDAAVRRLGYRPDPSAARLARARARQVVFLLPAGNNRFVELLRDQIEANTEWMRDQRIESGVLPVNVFNPGELAKAVLAQEGRCDAVVVMALDHPVVRSAIDQLTQAGTVVITLVSDVPSSTRQHYVGIDNTAAGRTAATLVGRFVGRGPATVAVVLGSLSLRDHAERYFGFNQVMAQEHPHLNVLPPVEGQDDAARNEVLATQLLAAHPELAAIYSVGAGNAGICQALRAAGRDQHTVFVGHELTAVSRAELLNGTMDAVINQDAGHEIRSALRLALAQWSREPVIADQERIRIDIYLKDNLP